MLVLSHCGFRVTWDKSLGLHFLFKETVIKPRVSLTFSGKPASLGFARPGSPHTFLKAQSRELSGWVPGLWGEVSQPGHQPYLSGDFPLQVCPGWEEGVMQVVEGAPQ